MKFKFSLIALFLFGSIWAIKVNASDDSTKKLEKTIVGKTFSYIEEKFNNFFFIVTDYGINLQDTNNNSLPDSIGSAPFSGTFKLTEAPAQ